MGEWGGGGGKKKAIFRGFLVKFLLLFVHIFLFMTNIFLILYITVVLSFVVFEVIVLYLEHELSELSITSGNIHITIAYIVKLESRNKTDMQLDG